MILLKKSFNTLFDQKIIQDERMSLEVSSKGIMFITRQKDKIYVDTPTNVSKPIKVDYKSLEKARKLSAKYRRAASGYEFHDTFVRLNDNDKNDDIQVEVDAPNLNAWELPDETKFTYSEAFVIDDELTYIFDNTSNISQEIFQDFQRSWLTSSRGKLYFVSSNGVSKHYFILCDYDTEFYHQLSEIQERLIKDLARELPEVVVSVQEGYIKLSFTKDENTVNLLMEMKKSHRPVWLDLPDDLEEQENVKVFVETEMVESLTGTPMRQFLQVRSTTARHTIGFIFEDGIVYRFQQNPETKSRFIEDEIDEDTLLDEENEESIESTFDLNRHQIICSYETDDWLGTSLVVHHGALKFILTDDGVLNVYLPEDEMVIKKDNLLYVTKRVDYE